MTSPTERAHTGERFHRIRFYPGKLSTFDSIEPCPTGPGKSCWGCTNKHDFCDKDGRLAKAAESQP